MMSESATEVESGKPHKPLAISEKVVLSIIDSSMKWPAIFFIFSAVLWLQAGTVFALLASFKMHSPEFLADYEFLTFGRVRSAHLTAVTYGWGFNAAFAIAVWIMARLSRSRVSHIPILLAGAITWNLAITLAVTSILAGQMTSVEWLEMPHHIAPIILVSFILIAVWTIVSFRFRESKPVYVSQLYILAAIFWFPWLYTVAQVMIFFEPAQGVIQPLVNWWFAHNVLGLWFTPIALGAAYYFIPKVLGKPIHSYYLSLLGFWAMALFYSWSGVHHLIGGPIPVWVISAGVVASVMMIIPVVVTAINYHMTVLGHFEKVWESPTLRFIVFGAISYTLASLIGCLISFRDVSEITHFTHVSIGHAHHINYAFFSMIMFGGFYYMFPRILNKEWPSATLIRAHFWMCAIGISLMLFALYFAGIIQGLQLNELDAESLPVYSFLEVMENTIPWLKVRSISGMLLAVGHMAFAINICWILLRTICKAEDEDADPIQLTQ